MLMPSLFGENLLDDFFGVADYPRFHEFGRAVNNVMHTDVKETEQGYEIAMNLPGFRKEDVRAELKDGYLTILASSNTSNDTKEEGKYIRKERYSGSCSRSFYVGEQITQEDIKAKFEDGVLRIAVPKKEAQKVVENNRYIPIEG